MCAPVFVHVRACMLEEGKLMDKRWRPVLLRERPVRYNFEMLQATSKSSAVRLGMEGRWWKEDPS